MNTIIVATSVLIIWIGVDVNCREYGGHFGSELQTRLHLRGRNWEADYRKLKREIKNFSSEYTAKARYIADFRESRKQEVTMMFEQVFYSALKRLQQKVNRFGQSSKYDLEARKGSFGEAAYKLHALLEKIPKIVSCILHVCKPEITLPIYTSGTVKSTTPTTVEEADSTEENATEEPESQ